MKTILTAALAFAALTSASLADGPVELTDAQMDKITAGYGVVYGTPCGDGSCLVGRYSPDGLSAGGGLASPDNS
jgi:hypothetical protein